MLSVEEHQNNPLGLYKIIVVPPTCFRTTLLDSPTVRSKGYVFSKNGCFSLDCRTGAHITNQASYAFNCMLKHQSTIVFLVHHYIYYVYNFPSSTVNLIHIGKSSCFEIWKHTDTSCSNVSSTYQNFP